MSQRTTTHATADETVGTFVLGLEPGAVRATFREHLTECDVCRDEWQQLRDLPPLLAMAVRLLRPEGAQPRA